MLGTPEIPHSNIGNSRPSISITSATEIPTRSRGVLLYMRPARRDRGRFALGMGFNNGFRDSEGGGNGLRKSKN